MTIKLVTIGVYGFSEDDFFNTLQRASVDTFCDVRWHRGLRGSRYSFANSRRLQRRLAQLGVRYLHRRDLAPPPAVRRRQVEADKRDNVAKRKRTSLSDSFIAVYKEEVLSGFEPRSLLDDLESDAKVVALFCVEGNPAACHRSLLAQELQEELNVEVEHLVPSPS